MRGKGKERGRRAEVDHAGHHGNQVSKVCVCVCTLYVCLYLSICPFIHSCACLPLPVCFSVSVHPSTLNSGQCVKVDMEGLALLLQLRLEPGPASSSAGSSRLLCSLAWSWMKHWSQSSGSSNIRKPRQMINTAIRRTALKWISHVYRSTTGTQHNKGLYYLKLNDQAFIT